MSTRLKQVETLRYERKFTVQAEDVKSLICLVKVHPVLFTESYEERRVNSLYFDTNDYSYYVDTTLGRSARHKVRLRWYGNHVEYIGDGKVEIKSKSGYLGSKDIFNFGSFSTSDFVANYRKYITSCEDLDKGCRELLSFLRPILIVSYLRKYFESADKNFRITIDYALSFYDVQSGFNPLKRVPSDLCILELKYQYENDELARAIANSIPSRYSRSSKYRIGLESI